MRIVALGDRDPSYLTHREIDGALELLPDDADCSWVATDTSEARNLDRADGVWLLPGTPYRDDQAAYRAIRYCRHTGTPFLGTCGGFQYACVELAVTLAGIPAAAHAETNPDATAPVIAPLRCSLYGERRTVRPVSGTQLAGICGSNPFEGFHYCGYGLADEYVAELVRGGVVVSAHADDAGVEAIELPEHPFFLATAFQPQMGNKASGRLHPLISALLTAARNRLAERATPGRSG